VPEIVSYLDTLAAQAHPEGGWGYVPGQQRHLEPTCLALLALSLAPDRFETAIAHGRRALDSMASEGYPKAPNARREAVWPTAWALFVQTALAYPHDQIEQTVGRLLAIKGRIPDDPEFAELVDIDCNLQGWPWGEGNFSWAEPTAWSCLALRHAGYGNHPRVAEGIRLLLDRACDEGGINYGNRRVLGRFTAPLPEPTACMLLAVQGQPDHPRIAAAVRYLEHEARAADDLELLCRARLALDLYQDQLSCPGTLTLLDKKITAAYGQRHNTPWVQPSSVREALTALALGAGIRNWFRISDGLSANRAVSMSAARDIRPWPDRVRSVLRGFLLHGANRLRPLPLHSAVHIAAASDYDCDLSDVLRRQYDSFRPRVPLAGKRVVIKPNLVEYHRDKVINTDPRVIAAVIELCRREGAVDIIVAEGPGHCRNAEHLVRASGLGDVLAEFRVPFIDLNHDEPVKRLNLGRLTGLDYLYLSQTVVAADVLISLPKLKTHHWAGATLSLKNLFGALPGICYGWPKNELHWRGIDNSIIDIALTRPPDLIIVDAIVGMEGDGPLNGTPKPLGALVMGIDPIAVDATCCRLMKLDPQRVGYLVMGHAKRLGLIAEPSITQLGEPVATLAQPFETVPHFQSLCVGRSA
jgi:uncharacterized protein (DUF362 family)